MNSQTVLLSSTSIQQQYQQIRERTEYICLPLEPEDTVVQPMVDVSPPKWHLAHTTWFFETFVLRPYLKGYKVFHPRYGYLFNSYYNSVGNRVQRAARSTITRPPLSDIYAYRQHVDENISKLLTRLDEQKLADVMPVLELGLQHEQQHQELLLTDIKYILSSNPLLPAYKMAKPLLPFETEPEVKATFLEVPGGIYEIGHKGDNFCFDNELGVNEVLLKDFQVMNRLVTNKEYLEFIEDGGYSNFRHWLDEGFTMVKNEGLKAPLYWVQEDDAWQRFTVYGMEVVDMNSPVTHLSFYEADAFANWSGKRLLTEFEWEAVAQTYKPKSGNFVETELLEPAPASAELPGVQQLFGDTWEWTYSAYHPYPGFTKAPGALGEYNGKFMINQMVLRGGSCVTPESHIRTTYRNFFHPDKRWQYSGIRLAC